MADSEVRGMGDLDAGYSLSRVNEKGELKGWRSSQRRTSSRPIDVIFLLILIFILIFGAE